MAAESRAKAAPRGRRHADLALLRARWLVQDCRRRHGSWWSCLRGNDRWPGPPPPFSASCRTVRLGGGGIDGLEVVIRRQASKCFEQIVPDLTPRPTVPAIVDGRVRAKHRRAIAPAAARLQDMNDATDHATIIDPTSARLILRQQWLDCCPLSITQPKLARHDPSPANTELESYPLEKLYT
jgi:hypothetical protein